MFLLPSDVSRRSLLHMTYAQAVAAQVRAEIARQSRDRNEIAQLAGLSDYCLRNRLNGNRAFTVADLEAVADALCVPVSVLVNPSMAGEPQ